MIDARGGGMRRGVAIPGGVGLAGVVVYLLIQVLSGGSGSAFGIDNQFGPSPQAPGATGIPAAQDPERDLKDFSGYVFSRSLDTWAELFAEERQPFERAQLAVPGRGVHGLR